MDDAAVVKEGLVGARRRRWSFLYPWLGGRWTDGVGTFVSYGGGIRSSSELGFLWEFHSGELRTSTRGSYELGGRENRPKFPPEGLGDGGAPEAELWFGSEEADPPSFAPRARGSMRGRGRWYEREAGGWLL